MGLVTIIFLAGGNMEKLVCEPFHTKEVFKASRWTTIWMELPTPFISILLPSAVQTSFQSWKWEVIQFSFRVIGVFLEDWSLLLLLCDIAGCRHSVSGPPRLEELHPGILVQWLWHGADSRELLQAKQTHFIFLAPFRSRVVIMIILTRVHTHTYTHTLLTLVNYQMGNCVRCHSSDEQI